MIVKIMKIGFYIRILSLVMMVAPFTFSIEKASSFTSLPEMSDADSAQGDETLLALDASRQGSHSQAEPAGAQNDPNVDSMMGHDHMKHGWMWIGLMIIMMAVMMVL